MDTKTKYNPDLGREIQDSLRAQHTNTPHTPTPWKVQARQTNLIPLLPAIHNESGVRICTMNSIDVLTETENAAHIVRCVNRHDELVDALRGMLNWARRVTQLNPGPEVADAVRILARAREER